MNAGNVKTSPVLQATLAVLSDGHWHTSMEIHDRTNGMAAHSDVAALRAPPNNMVIECRYERRSVTTGRKVYSYKLVV